MQLILTGAKEVDDVLRGLPLQMNHRVIGAANADAAKPLIAAARSLAPKDTDKLAESIAAVKMPLSLSTNLGEVQVGPRLNRGGYKGHWIEYGTRERKTKGRGTVRGYKDAGRGIVRPHPFMGPAFEMTRDEVLSRIADSIGKKLYAFMKRTIKNAG